MERSQRILVSTATQLFVLLTVWLFVIALVFFVPVNLRESLPGANTRGPSRLQQDGFSDRADHAALFVSGLLRGQLVHPNTNVEMGEELRRFGRPTLILALIALTAGTALGGGSAIAVWLLRRRRGGGRGGLWDVGIFAGVALPESVVTALIWLGAYALYLHYDFYPFPRIWVIDISWRHYVLPGLAMAVFPAAYMGRTLMGAFAELEGELYLRVARSKGLSDWQILTGHALKPVGYRFFTAMPTLAAWVLSALIVVEFIFLVPGVGRNVGLMLAFRGVDPFRLGAYVTAFMIGLSFISIASSLLAAALDPRSGEHGS